MPIISASEIINCLEQIGIVPVIKIENTSKANYLAKALIDGGINCAEVTFRAEGADKVIESITKGFPDMLVGAGTVLTCEQVDKAISAGAKFLVAPGFNPVVIKHCLDKGVLFIPGVSSGSEIEQALDMGLTAVKFFPAEQAGGLPYIKALCGPYSGIRFMPTSGINENNMLEYLAFERVFACGGSWMVTPQLISQENWSEITALCKNAVNKMLGFELAHVGINCSDEFAASDIAKQFNSAFGFGINDGNSSVFANQGLEIMKSMYLGKNGHLAIKTNSIVRSIYALKNRGYEVDIKTAKYDKAGKMTAIYLTKEIGGFAVHLLQKK